MFLFTVVKWFKRITFWFWKQVFCLFIQQKIPENSVIMLHACAHNPTGVDPKVCNNVLTLPLPRVAKFHFVKWCKTYSTF